MLSNELLTGGGGGLRLAAAGLRAVAAAWRRGLPLRMSSQRNTCRPRAHSQQVVTPTVVQAPPFRQGSAAHGSKFSWRVSNKTSLAAADGARAYCRTLSTVEAQRFARIGRRWWRRRWRRGRNLAVAACVPIDAAASILIDAIRTNRRADRDCRAAAIRQIRLALVT